MFICLFQEVRPKGNAARNLLKKTEKKNMILYFGRQSHIAPRLLRRVFGLLLGALWEEPVFLRGFPLPGALGLLDPLRPPLAYRLFRWHCSSRKGLRRSKKLYPLPSPHNSHPRQAETRVHLLHPCSCKRMAPANLR